MSRVAVAAASQLAAGAEIGQLGGNAVDAAIAASFVSMTTDPGIVALGGGSYVTVSEPDGSTVVIDGYVEMPGRSAPTERIGTGIHSVHIDYGGGLDTGIGYGSVATPGSVAAHGVASEHHGALDWSDLLGPARRWARDGFPMPAAAAEYLTVAGEPIFGWHPESRASLLRHDGRPRTAGERVHCAGLADSLALLAEDGPDAFSTGKIGRRIADDVASNGGILDRDDLAAYTPITRDALEVDLGGWRFATNPGPAIGGVAVAAVLALVRDETSWTAETVDRLAGAFDAVLTFRRRHYDLAARREPVIARLIELARDGDMPSMLAAPSTVHVSAVDEDGRACAITSSSGYGSGVVVPGTGIWLNNALGEVDLLRSELSDVAPGTRLPSNMAPSVARGPDGSVLAVGSPGASRITSAIAQTVFHHLCLGRSLDEAVEQPRVHAEMVGERVVIAHEPGLPEGSLKGFELRPFDRQSMYFGGAQAARRHADGSLEATADPRRAGGTAVSA
jgi:gamma-glutamyltranspeptidase/glutathione hydrolase